MNIKVSKSLYSKLSGYSRRSKRTIEEIVEVSLDQFMAKQSAEAWGLYMLGSDWREFERRKVRKK